VTTRRSALAAIGMTIAIGIHCTSADAEAWSKTEASVSVPAAGISLPERAGSLSLRQTGEFSEGGKGIDNFAQYATPDGAIEGTAYVYLPPYSDAALTAFETGRVIKIRFGQDIALTSTSIVGSGRAADSVIRNIYDQNSDGRTTTAAFLKAGDWIVKLRVSGPKSRRAEVIGGLDALIAGLTFTEGSKPARAADLQISECPAALAKSAHKQQLASAFGTSPDPLTESLLQGALSTYVTKNGDGKADRLETIARNGLKSVCVRDHLTIGTSDIPIIQPTGSGDTPEAVIALINDAGAMVEMHQQLLGKGYTVAYHEIGRTTAYGTFNRPLSTDQLRRLLTGDKWEYPVVSVTTYEADGTTNTNIEITTNP
jgi:hypothetical protein